MRRRIGPLAVAFGSAFVLSGCFLAPSDPPPPLVALWVDGGVLKVAVGTCLGDIEKVSILQVGADGVPEAEPHFEADITGGSSSVTLDGPGVDATGEYSLAERFVIEVKTASALASGVWPGASAISTLLGGEVVVVDEQVIDAGDFEGRACP